MPPVKPRRRRRCRPGPTSSAAATHNTGRIVINPHLLSRALGAAPSGRPQDPGDFGLAPPRREAGRGFTLGDRMWYRRRAPAAAERARPHRRRSVQRGQAPCSPGGRRRSRRAALEQQLRRRQVSSRRDVHQRRLADLGSGAHIGPAARRAARLTAASRVNMIGVTPEASPDSGSAPFSRSSFVASALALTAGKSGVAPTSVAALTSAPASSR